MDPESIPLSSIADLLTEGVALFDADDRIVYTNLAFRELHPGIGDRSLPGTPFADLAGAAWAADGLELNANDYTAWLDAAIERHRRCGPPYRLGLRDGRVLRLRDCRMPQGGILTSVSEVTGTDAPRFHHAPHGRANGQWLSWVMDHCPIILWATNVDGTIVLSEGKGLKAQSYEPGELVGRRIQDVYHGHPEFLYNYQRALQGESFTAVNWTAGGFFERYFEPLFDEAGAICGVTGVSIDVTDRVQAEQELERHRDHLEQRVAERTMELEASERRLRQILESSPAGIAVICQRTFERLFVNRRYLDMFGARDAQEMNRYSLRDTYVDPEQWEHLHNSLVEQQGPIDNDVERLRLDGSKMWLRVEGQVMDFAGQPTALVWHFDVTERHRQTEELRVTNELLAAEVKERALAEAQARRAKDEAEERLRQLREVQDKLLRSERLATLGQLTGTVSHELRNPLGTIRASVEVIRRGLEGQASERLLRPIERVERSIDRCVRIIQQLLDFARIRPAAMTETRMDQWIRETVAELELPCDVEVSLDLRCDVTVQVDREKLRQVLSNVLENAAHAVQEGCDGQAEIRIATLITPARVEIRISDNGPGIAREMRDSVFEPLVSTKPFGIGLGLPLVRQIMEHHGGGADFVSASRGRTTLCLWLPLTCETLDCAGPEP